MTYKHYIVTRFNLRLWVADKFQNSTRTPQWLDERFELFFKYCLPSVTRQTSKNFTWICLFDAETPDRYKKIIANIKDDLDNFWPIFFTDEETAQWKEILRKKIYEDTGNAEYVLSTNLDNDDAIHTQYVEKIQSYFIKHQETGLYTFLYGLQYFTSYKLLLKMRYPHNHFFTLVEPLSKDLKIISTIAHSVAWRDYKKEAVRISEEPLWLEVVHSSNIGNDLRITSRVKYHCIWRKYNLSAFAQSTSFHVMENVIKNLLIYPYCFMKAGYHKIEKKLHKQRESTRMDIPNT